MPTRNGLRCSPYLLPYYNGRTTSEKKPASKGKVRTRHRRVRRCGAAQARRLNSRRRTKRRYERYRNSLPLPVHVLMCLDRSRFPVCGSSSFSPKRLRASLRHPPRPIRLGGPTLRCHRRRHTRHTRLHTFRQGASKAGNASRPLGPLPWRVRQICLLAHRRGGIRARSAPSTWKRRVHRHNLMTSSMGDM